MIQGKFSAPDETILLDLLYGVMSGKLRRMDAELAEAKIKISCYRIGDGIRLDITATAIKEGA